MPRPVGDTPIVPAAGAAFLLDELATARPAAAAPPATAIHSHFFDDPPLPPDITCSTAAPDGMFARVSLTASGNTPRAGTVTMRAFSRKPFLTMRTRCGPAAISATR